MNLALTLHNAIESESKPRVRLKIFVAGIGAVGSTLINQIKELEHHKYELQIIGYCNSSGTVWQPGDLLNMNSDNGVLTDWEIIPQKLSAMGGENILFVDATGSEEVAKRYEQLLKNGIHVVTPSKIANSSEQSLFDRLVKLGDSAGTYAYETTVGAGLPVISTLNSLINSGDEIQRINGVLSGTMTYLFNQIEQGSSFSSAVLKARELGYSEPDPRDDLSGLDVARKFLIMARTCGQRFELSDIRLDTLVPEDLIDLSVDDFLKKIPSFDGHWKSRNSTALVNNRKLRYTGDLSAEGIRVGVEEVRQDSPLANLKGTDNLIRIFTRRYGDSPIVIQGPGAGKEVTAAGILSEIVSI